MNKGSSDFSVTIIEGQFFSNTFFCLKNLSKISVMPKAVIHEMKQFLGASFWKDWFLKLLDLQSHHTVRFEHLELKDSTLRPALTKHHGNTFNQGQ